MAAFMITGGKIGAIIGRRRAFGIGLVVYACGSFVTSIAPNLTVLIIGWSLLEGLGAALIMPAIVALVAGNVPKEGRSAAYGLIAAAGAIAVAAGPAHRGRRHHLRVVALGVRRRGGHRRRHPPASSAGIHDTPPEERAPSTWSAPSCPWSASA